MFRYSDTRNRQHKLECFVEGIRMLKMLRNPLQRARVTPSMLLSTLRKISRISTPMNAPASYPFLCWQTKMITKILDYSKITLNSKVIKANFVALDAKLAKSITTRVFFAKTLASSTNIRVEASDYKIADNATILNRDSKKSGDILRTKFTTNSTSYSPEFFEDIIPELMEFRIWSLPSLTLPQALYILEITQRNIAPGKVITLGVWTAILVQLLHSHSDCGTIAWEFMNYTMQEDHLSEPDLHILFQFLRFHFRNYDYRRAFIVYIALKRHFHPLPHWVFQYMIFQLEKRIAAGWDGSEDQAMQRVLVMDYFGKVKADRAYRFGVNYRRPYIYSGCSLFGFLRSRAHCMHGRRLRRLRRFEFESGVKYQMWKSKI